MLSGKLPAPWEGIVPGGGVALFRSAGALEMLKVESEEQIGVAILTRACEEPLRQICRNAGFEGAVVAWITRRGMSRRAQVEWA